MMALVGASSPSRDGSAQNSLYPGSQDIFGNLSTAVDARMDNPSTQSPLFNLLPSQSKDAMTGGYGSVPAPAPTTAAPGSNTQNWLSNYAKNMPAGGDADRASGEALMKSAGDRLNSAASAPAPVYNRPTLSPLEALGLALAAGAGNSASPYTSEGSKFFDSFTGSREQQAQQDYQQAQAQRQQQMQAAQTGYKVAGDQAATFNSSADDADKNLQNAKNRLAGAGLNEAQVIDLHAHEAAVGAAANSESDRQALRDHGLALDFAAKQLDNQIRLAGAQGQIRDASSANELMMQNIMANPALRQIYTEDHFIKSGYKPQEAHDMSVLAGQSTPAETLQMLQVDNQRVLLQSAKIDLANKPALDALNRGVIQAQTGQLGASAGDATARAEATRAATARLDTMSPQEKLKYFGDSLGAANTVLTHAVIARTKFITDWERSHLANSFNMATGGKAPVMEDDPEYKTLNTGVSSAVTGLHLYQSMGNKILGLKDDFGATPGSPSPAVPTNISPLPDSGVTSGANPNHFQKVKP